ncbi:MAG: HNH endonuclease [Pseudomonadota bacterium]|jgi:hypothetical protein
MAKPRNYRLEYDRTQGTPKGIADRAARNKARRIMEKAGRVKKGDGLHVDHKNFNPRNNSPSNLRVVSQKVNSRRQPKRK